MTSFAPFSKSLELASAAKLEADFVSELQRVLSQLPSQKVLRIWFGNDKLLPDDLAADFNKLRKIVRRQSDLFRWVYGENNPHAVDALNVKIASKEKKQLVDLLIADCRCRYPWMTSRMIHAFAFAPNTFKKRDSETKDWGPLYRRVAIPKGSGNRSRYLWIPNPPLKRLQKSLLRIIGPSLESKLHANIFGVRIGDKAPTFENALCHAHSGKLVSFDIRDFFPSTTINEVLKGIRWGKNESSLMVSSQYLPNRFEGSMQRRDLKWTHDAEILVARLGTYRGRLPQGSPLSPILANLAFTPYDEKLIGLLSGRFGKKGFHYTRYFDDITISFLGSGDILGQDRKGLQVECERILHEALKSSPYRLNNGKTRSSNISDSSGHKITGLVVRSGRVTIPRKLKRSIRVILHNLAEVGFVESAKKWSRANVRGFPEFQSLTKGHIWKTHSVRGRRMSAERMAWLMLRHFYPDLKIERLMQDWHGWQEMYDADSSVSQGKGVSTPIQRILAAAWEGNVSVNSIDASSKELQVSQASVPIARLIADTNLSFFLLEKRTAITLVEFWHYLHGLVNYLKACPCEPEFKQVSELTTKLELALKGLELESNSESLSTNDPTLQRTPETIRDRILKESKHVVDRWLQYSDQIDSRPRRTDVRLLREKHDGVVVESEEDLFGWLANLSCMINRLPLLPSQSTTGQKWMPRDVYDYLRVKEEKNSKKIFDSYVIESNFESANRTISTLAVQKRQLQFLRYFRDLFDETANYRRNVGEDRWRTSLIVNVEHRSLEARVKSAADKALKLVDKLSDSSKGESFLLPQASDSFGDPQICQLVEKRDFDLNSDASWKELTRASHELFKSIKDSITDSAFERLPEELIRKKTDSADSKKLDIEVKRNTVNSYLKSRIDDQQRTSLRILEWLRHRGAHGMDEGKPKEKQRLQNSVCRLLCRKLNSPNSTEEPSARMTLDITGYEAARIWLACLEGVVSLLQEAESFMNSQENTRP